jgi:flagellar assembly factor FliW
VNSPAKQDTETCANPSTAEQPFFFPAGLLGFSSHRNFILVPYRPADGSASPFFVLQAVEDDLSFPLISPHWVVSDYKVAPPPELLTVLGAASPAELSVFVIVTLRERAEEITANLQGPILLNPASRLGLQLVVEQYPLRHPLISPRQL